MNTDMKPLLCHLMSAQVIHCLGICCMQGLHPEHFSLLKKVELNFCRFKAVSPLVEQWRETKGRESDIFKVPNQK